MSVPEAQTAVVAALREEGRLRSEEPYTHSVPFSERSGERIEPLISLQWFCRMDELAGAGDRRRPPGRGADRAGQLQAGVPGLDGEHPPVVRVAPAVVGPPAAGLVRPRGRGDRRDLRGAGAARRPPAAASTRTRCARRPTSSTPGSAPRLWPFATLGWPADDPRLGAFYPTSFLTTAREIIFLWVARMVMMGIEFAGDIPFRDVYVHPVIQAPDGRRMSKSLGTGIDPARRDRRPRRRRPSLRPARDVLDPGRPLLGRPGPAGPRPRQQDVERVAPRPAERRRHGARAANDARRGPLDPLAAGANRRLGHGASSTPTTSPTPRSSSTASSGRSSATGTWRSSSRGCTTARRKPRPTCSTCWSAPWRWPIR